MNQPDQESSNHDTMEFEVPQRANPRPQKVCSALVQVDFAAQSHQGFVRNNNEDHYLAVRVTRSLTTVLTNMAEGSLPSSFDETAYGIGVADGMGGMAAGEVASRLALLKLTELVVQTPDWVMKMNEPENAATVMRRMTRRFRQIDDDLRERGESNRSLHGMGTIFCGARDSIN
jgi:protein phosphatase